MSRISRRAVIKTALAMPVAASIAPKLSPAMTPQQDRLVLATQAWLAEHDLREAMIHRWQDLETILFDRARHMNIDCDVMCRGDTSEARAMRDLDHRIDSSYKHLVAAAGRARRMKATTIEGAIAKVELGLAVQGPFDWNDHALELAQDGLAALKVFAAAP